MKKLRTKTPNTLKKPDRKIKGLIPYPNLPEYLIADRGPEYYSRELLDACAQLSMTVQLCPVARPTSKAATEKSVTQLDRRSQT